MSTLINIDGEIYSEGEAGVPVFDRGFLYGDSIYEVMRGFGKTVFTLDEHLERLRLSADLLYMDLPISMKRLKSKILGLLEMAGNPESYIRVIVTRGEGEIGLDPALAVNPHYVIIAREFQPPPEHLYREGARVLFVRSGRVVDGALPCGAKTGNYLVNVMALREARMKGCHEAILINGRGQVTEGTTCNFFIVKGGGLFTPSLDAGLLAGITRSIVIKLCKGAGIDCEETPLSPEECLEADEAFLTSTIRDVMPITVIDNHWIGDGKPGPITESLRKAFLDYVRDYLR